jgi:Family of unknown function (DUF6065)
MCDIEFHLIAEMQGTIPAPYPASQHVPEWFKNMAADFPLGGTVKRCPPYLMAMTAGYIIPAPADLLLTMSTTRELSARGTVSYISTHYPQQYAGSPFADYTVVKFENPWIIVTPPDFVCLITGPLNRFELPFQPLAGIVETGTYYKEVQLPMVCLLQPGQSYQLRAGEPMIHVLPFRRDEWRGKMAPLDRGRRAEQQALFDDNKHAYKDKFWRKISFT